MQRDDIVVVGGGVAGLAAAALAAEGGGRRVTVLEQAGTLGGRARTTTLAGCAVNLGPHALYQRGAGSAVLRALGISPAGGVPPTGGETSWEGRRLPLPVDPVAMLRSPILGWRGSLALGRALATRPAALRGRSVAAWLDEARLPAGARATAEALLRVSTYAHAPAELSAEAGLAQLHLALRGGVRYLDGGWQPMVDALAAAARERGVQIRTSAGAAGLRWDGARPAAVILSDGEEVPAAGGVILAVGPAAARRLLGARAPAWAPMVPARAACLDVILAELPRPEGRFALSLDEASYLSLHSDVAKLGGEGAVLHVARYLAPGESVGVEALEAVLDRHQPGWRERAIEQRFLPALTVTAGIPRWDAPRPAVAVEGTGGVYLAGDWVGPTGMLVDAALASAAEAARQVRGGGVRVEEAMAAA